MRKRKFTKKPMKLSSFRIKAKDAEFMRTAAAKEEISQAEFLRRSIRERAMRIISGEGLQIAS